MALPNKIIRKKVCRNSACLGISMAILCDIAVFSFQASEFRHTIICFHIRHKSISKRMCACYELSVYDFSVVFRIKNSTKDIRICSICFAGELYKSNDAEFYCDAETFLQNISTPNKCVQDVSAERENGEINPSVVCELSIR